MPSILTCTHPPPAHRQAAEGGDAGAMAHLGHMYANGNGVEQSNTTALHWFKDAAEQNVPSAHFGLGYMHLSGFGVPMDHRLAFKYFSQAAEQVGGGVFSAQDCSRLRNKSYSGQLGVDSLVC